jgi:chromate reductase, NAD(P)H dehydrogenase (quinone)
MTDAITILGMAGSLRQGSFNAALLRAAAAAAPAGCTVDIASIRVIPHYDGDVEAAAGVPAVVEARKERVAAADGLLLVTPEYNNSMPGVCKNAIDWLSRPPQDIPRVFGGRPVALMGATPGGLGTVHAQTAWLPVVRALGLQPWFGTPLYVSGAHTVCDASGALLDEQLRERLQSYMTGCVAFVQRRS